MIHRTRKIPSAARGDSSAAHLAERSHIHGFLSVKVAHLSLKFLQCEQEKPQDWWKSYVGKAKSKKKQHTVVSTAVFFSITSSVPVSWPALATYIYIYIYTNVYIYYIYKYIYIYILFYDIVILINGFQKKKNKQTTHVLR